MKRSQRQLNRSRREPLMEALESRQLLSAVGFAHKAADAVSITLPSTYDGTLHAGGPKATAGNHAFSLTLANQTPNGQLTGAMSVTGIGAYLFTGTLNRGTMTLYFHDAGPSAGRFTARVNSDGSLITGRWMDMTGAQRISGSVRATPGTTAASAPGVPTIVGSTASTDKLQQKNLIASYSGRAHLSGPRAFQLSISPYTITLNITNESQAGLVSGTLGLLGLNINITGLVSGGRLSFVLTGPAAGEGTAGFTSTANRLTGSMVARFAAGPVHCAFVLYNPSAPKPGAATSRGSTTGTAFNGSGLPGQPGSTPSPISGLPTGGTTTTGTGTTGLGTGSFIPPTSGGTGSTTL